MVQGVLDKLMENKFPKVHHRVQKGRRFASAPPYIAAGRKWSRKKEKRCVEGEEDERQAAEIKRTENVATEVECFAIFAQVLSSAF